MLLTLSRDTRIIQPVRIVSFFGRWVFDGGPRLLGHDGGLPRDPLGRRGETTRVRGGSRVSFVLGMHPFLDDEKYRSEIKN